MPEIDCIYSRIGADYLRKMADELTSEIPDATDKEMIAIIMFAVSESIIEYDTYGMSTKDPTKFIRELLPSAFY